MATKQAITDIKRKLRARASQPVDEPLTGGGKGALIGHLNQAAGNDAMRRLILFVWFREEDDQEPQGLSTKDLAEGEWKALENLADAFEYEGTWLTSGKFQQAVDQTKAYVNFKLM